jgi:GTPase SAR1 family protein
MLEHLTWILPAIKEAYKGRDDAKDAWSKVFGKNRIVFTGLSGAGKSVLLDFLTGKGFEQGYQPPKPSQSVEKGKLSKTLKKDKPRMALSVIPGQDDFPRLQSLDEIFLGKKGVDGVIHVVSNGFVEERSLEARNLLIKETKLQTIEQFRQYQLKKELTDLNETCEIIRKSIHKHRKPKWLLVTVTKSDLFYDKLNEAREYYSPNGKSKFAKRLKELQIRVGTDNFRWEAVPVCAWLKDFEWNNQIQPSVLKVDERDHFIANFAAEMANYSK